VIEAKLSGKHEIEIWGDGHQTRSFMYIDDCLQGHPESCTATSSMPINLGSSELVVHQPAGRHRRRHRRHQAQAQLQFEGAQGRQRPQQRQHADQKLLGWEPPPSSRRIFSRNFFQHLPAADRPAPLHRRRHPPCSRRLLGDGFESRPTHRTGKVENPDFHARILESVNRFILHRANLIVALDRFMADRLSRAACPPTKC
jgi:hypothetical protein